MATLLTIKTPGRGAVNITSEIEAVVAGSNLQSGVAHIFIQHTSASLAIQENADPDVQRDLLTWLDRIAPEDGPYHHRAEGPDDMPAHLKSMITATSITIPFDDGRLLTGTWQGIFVLEHRRAPYQRRVVVTLIAGN